MPECPSCHELALFVEGRCPETEATAIRRHVVGCAACSGVLSSLLQTHDAEAVGLLPTLSDTEQDAAIRAIGLGAQRIRQGGAKGPEQETDASTASNAIELFFGVAAAAGVAALISPPSVPPVSPAEHGNPASNGADVRNPPAHDSVLARGPDSMDPGHETHDMHAVQNGVGMQSSINDYFGAAPDVVRDAPDHIGQPAAPGEFSMDVKQAYSDTCAVRCQELVLHDFGVPVTQAGLVQEAKSRGWYVPGGGTPESDLGKLLEAHGISVHHYENGNIFTLVNELAQGHRVIITVDSGELWSSNEILRPIAEMNKEAWADWRPDHAVIVSGVDISDPSHPLVVVTDPGTGEVAARYALPDFMAAWQDSGFDMVATNTAPSHFPMDHISWIGNVSYDEFAQMLPSVEGLTGHEPGFADLCSHFLQLVREADAGIHEKLSELVSGYGHEWSTPEDHHGHLFPGIEGHSHETDPVASDSDSHHNHGL